MGTTANTAPIVPARAGELRKHEKFRSRFLPAPRDLIVYLPPGYGASRKRFPVLYMQDGQNLFDPATSFVPGVYWRMQEAADGSIAAGLMRPLIIVGIYNTKNRIREYTPIRNPKGEGGGADRYGKMLTQEIKPFVESTYRVLSGSANTGLGGSSLGGLLTLYLGLREPETFGKLAALSPSIWWKDRSILRIAERLRVRLRPRIWLDSGTHEGEHTIEDARMMRDLLLRKGWQPGSDLHYEEIEGGEHNEAAWALRIGPCLQFLFPTDDK